MKLVTDSKNVYNNLISLNVAPEIAKSYIEKLQKEQGMANPQPTSTKKKAKPKKIIKKNCPPKKYIDLKSGSKQNFTLTLDAVTGYARENLNSPAYMLLQLLTELTKFSKTRSVCICQIKLARLLHKSVRALQRSLNVLRERGFLVVTPHATEDGRQPNTYTLCMPESLSNDIKKEQKGKDKQSDKNIVDINIKKILI